MVDEVEIHATVVRIAKNAVYNWVTAVEPANNAIPGSSWAAVRKAASGLRRPHHIQGSFKVWIDLFWYFPPLEMKDLG